MSQSFAFYSFKNLFSGKDEMTILSPPRRQNVYTRLSSPFHHFCLLPFLYSFSLPHFEAGGLEGRRCCINFPLLSRGLFPPSVITHTWRKMWKCFSFISRWDNAATQRRTILVFIATTAGLIDSEKVFERIWPEQTHNLKTLTKAFYPVRKKGESGWKKEAFLKKLVRSSRAVSCDDKD